MKMEEKAATDEMTGLYNKNKLLATIEKRTYDYQQVAIVYWDINRLKYVNVYNGHFAGDQMIVKRGTVNTDCFRRCRDGIPVWWR